MRIGYPCLNTALGCRSSRTFRLASYSEKRLMETVESNLDCLAAILRYNVHHNILFFRITSDLVPFASHPICQVDWPSCFEEQFHTLGEFIKDHRLRISMHPDQFTLLNSPDPNVVENSVRELAYHAQVLDLMALDTSAKIQIHVGGVYGDKGRSLERFRTQFESLETALKRRLVVENDDRRYTVRDCVRISAATGIPVLFDVFHHESHSSGETISEALRRVAKTWKIKDGVPMVDYSTQRRGHRVGTHAEALDRAHFGDFLARSRPYDFDVMLEIKDKEVSALKAIEIASHDNRFRAAQRASDGA